MAGRSLPRPGLLTSRVDSVLEPLPALKDEPARTDISCMNREPLARGPVQGLPNPQKRLGVALVGLAVGFGVLFLLSFGPTLLRTTDDEACVNRSEANAYNDRASQAVADATEAIEAGDIAAGVSHMREAAHWYRALAEAFAAANPDVAQLLAQASALHDQAADATEQGRRAIAVARTEDAAELLDQAGARLNASTVQSC